MRILIIGVGGTGTWLTEGIARLLEYQAPGSVLMLVDGDHFEPKNRERQSFEKIGNKAEVKAEEMSPMFPQTFIVPVPKWIVANVQGEESESQITPIDLLEEDDIVFCVVDNFACRKLIFDAAKEYKNIHIFTGGNDDALFGSVYHYHRRDGNDVTDHPVVMHPDEYENPPDRNPGAMTCQERAMLEGGSQLLASNMAVAAYLLARAHKCLIAEEDDLQGEIFFDLGLGLARAEDRRSDVELGIAGEKELNLQ